LGGISLLLSLWRKLDVSTAIDQNMHVLRRRKVYYESDHVLAHVLNLFSGGNCIEDQAALQQDCAVLRMLGTDRFPDPTTSGDFLRRFDESVNPGSLDALRSAVDAVQDLVWETLRTKRRRRAKLGHWGLVDLDSHIVPLTGDQKEGADFSYTGKWSYHPVLVTLANTSDVLAVRNRPGNAASADGVEELLEEHLPRVNGWFKEVVVRGDSAFDRAELRATCGRHGAHFAHVAKRRKDRTVRTQDISDDGWTPWQPQSRRRAEARRAAQEFRPRRKGKNRRRPRALSRFYLTKRKAAQWIAETTCKPTKDEPPCRLIIIRELVEETCTPSQRILFESYTYRFFLSDLPEEFSASDIVDQVYDRCDQEKTIEQLKNELVMWRMPVREAAGNAAWLEISRLAWSLGKALSMLVLPLETLRWEWKRFRRAFVFAAAEVLLRSRQTWVRFNPSHRYVPVLITAHARLGP